MSITRSGVPMGNYNNYNHWIQALKYAHCIQSGLDTTALVKCNWQVSKKLSGVTNGIFICMHVHMLYVYGT